MSRAGRLGGGTEEEQASRWRRRACFVPVRIADEVTKTILNSPKALTASSDRCYCRRQSNTTVWIRRNKKKQKQKNDKKRVYRRYTKQRLGPGQTHKTPGRAGALLEVQARGAGGNDGGLSRIHVKSQPLKTSSSTSRNFQKVLAHSNKIKNTLKENKESRTSFVAPLLTIYRLSPGKKHTDHQKHPK